MADSDTTTTLPLVTRKMTSSNLAACRSHGDTPPANGKGGHDPVVLLAEKWRDAQARALALCRRQQRLENRLMRHLGHPPFPEQPDRGAELADAAASEAGDHPTHGLALAYSQAKLAEAGAAQAAEALLDELAGTPAQSLEGVIAILDVLLEESRTHDDPAGFPWPHIHSVLSDLKQLAKLDCGPQPTSDPRISSGSSISPPGEPASG